MYKFFSRIRLIKSIVIATLSSGILGCQSTPLGTVTQDLARDQLGVSVLSVNLMDILNVPRSSQDGVPWQTRYARIFTWMKDNQTFPDVIALQEAPAFWSCPTDGRKLPDYAAIDFLLDGIREASGEQYRIAYLIAGKPHGSGGSDWIGTTPVGLCSTQGDMALLYRPSRVRNVITSPGATDTVITAYTEPLPLQSSYLARSVQCCSPAADRSDVCQFIDEPATVPQPGHFEATMGTCATPLGLAWTRSRLATQGSNRSRATMDALFSRFELVGQPGNFFHIYNVHRGWNQDWGDQHPDGSAAPQILDFGSQNINQLVSDMENKFRSTGEASYPPILVGDFNLGAPLEAELFPPMTSYFQRFEVGTFFGIDGVLFGKRSDFPSKQAAYANISQQIPNLLDGESCDSVPDKLWSDHCGIYFRIEPSRR